jgi:hypothetical protein
MSHLAQLRHLMPEALALEWVRLSVAAHSSRTEPHLLVSLNTAAAAAAAAQSGAVPAAAADGEMQAARRLLHCRLAAHLLDSYREHLGARAARLRQAGDAAAAEPLEAAAAAAEEPPVAQFVPPYPEDATDVPQEQLPPRPEAQVAARSPAILPSAGPAAAAQRLDVPATPATAGLAPPPSTGRTGRPPMHPSTVARQAHKQRRLSFSQAGLAAAGELSRAATVPASTLAASAARGQVTGRATKPGTPLDKLHSQLASPAAQQHATPARGLLDERPQQTSGAAAELHPKQAALAAALAPEDLQFGACLPDALDAQAQADAALLAGMPEQLRRLSTDGIISMDTLRVRAGLPIGLCSAGSAWQGIWPAASRDVGERRQSCLKQHLPARHGRCPASNGVALPLPKDGLQWCAVCIRGTSEKLLCLLDPPAAEAGGCGAGAPPAEQPRGARAARQQCGARPAAAHFQPAAAHLRGAGGLRGTTSAQTHWLTTGFIGAASLLPPSPATPLSGNFRHILQLQVTFLPPTPPPPPQGPNALKLREVVQRIRQGGAETSSAADVEAQLRALALHAPEYLTLKPYGSCGTPALWVNRRADSAAVAARLRQVAEARLAPLEGGPA